MQRPWPAPGGDHQPRPAPAADHQPRPAPTGDHQLRPAPGGDHQPRPAPAGDHQPTRNALISLSARRPSVAKVTTQLSQDVNIDRQSNDPRLPPDRGEEHARRMKQDRRAVDELQFERSNRDQTMYYWVRGRYDGCDQHRHPNCCNLLRNLVLGSCLAVCGNVLISISLNLQKYVHLRNAARELQVQRHYTRELLWWLGLVLMGAGELFNFIAYGFAPASLVAPLGSTTVVANLFVAAMFLKEKIRSENLFGCALAIIGAFLLVTFSGDNEKVMGSYEITRSLAQPIFIAYVCLEMIVLSGLLILLYCKGVKHVLVYLLISSVTASFTVISAKAVSGMLQLSIVGFNQWNKPVLYAMLVVLVLTAVIQIKYVNLAMKSADATIVVPVNFVIFTISAILAGIIFYKEFFGMSGLQMTMFLFGCALSFLAVYFIAVGKSSNTVGVIPDIKSQQVTSDLIPSWMLASMNIGHVQPHGRVEHLKNIDSDKVPILRAEALETIEEQTECSSRYGDDSDSVSVTSMDMLVDRDKLGLDDKNIYGATNLDGKGSFADMVLGGPILGVVGQTFTDMALRARIL